MLNNIWAIWEPGRNVCYRANLFPPFESTNDSNDSTLQTFLSKYQRVRIFCYNNL